jgi:hypothetical protein
VTGGDEGGSGNGARSGAGVNGAGPTRRTVIVTTHEWPAPPFTGSTAGAQLKIHDVMRFLADAYDVEAIVYSDRRHAGNLLAEYWADRVRFHVLTPRMRLARVKAVVRRTLRTSEARRWHEEARIIDSILERDSSAVLVVDGLSGAAIVRDYVGGTICSVHDAMSRYFAIQAIHAGGSGARSLARLRSRGARRLERIYLPLFNIVHVVSEADGSVLADVCSAIRTIVIPIFGEAPCRLGNRSEGAEPGKPRLVVWGNLGLGPISEGFLQLLACERWREVEEVFDVEVLGRLTSGEFWQRFPTAVGRVRYAAEVVDLEDYLRRAAIVVVPDVSGCGQKTRTFAAMRLGCCVAGFGEAFRGLPDDGSCAFLVAPSPIDLIDCIVNAFRSGDYIGVGERARDFMVEHLGEARIAAAWRKLIESQPPLSRRLR